MKDIRTKKNEFIKKVNLNYLDMFSMKKLKPKIKILSRYLQQISIEVYKRIFLLGLKNEIYLKTKYPTIIS